MSELAPRPGSFCLDSRSCHNSKCVKEAVSRDSFGRFWCGECWHRRHELEISPASERQDDSAAVKVVGYKLTRKDCSGWLFAGTTPAEVAETLKNELDLHDGLPADECGDILIRAYETTRDEIDALPEHGGW